MYEKPSETVKAIMKERFGHDTLLSLATTDKERPYVRIVNSYYEDGCFYIITDARSHKMQQIKSHPEVAVCGEWFSAHGIGENIGHLLAPRHEKLRQTLHSAFASWYDNGHICESDPHICILRIRLSDAILFSHGTCYEVDFTQ